MTLRRYAVRRPAVIRLAPAADSMIIGTAPAGRQFDGEPVSELGRHWVRVGAIGATVQRERYIAAEDLMEVPDAQRAEM